MTMRARKILYKQKLTIAIVIITIVIFTHQTIFSVSPTTQLTDQKNLQTMKKLAHDKSVAKVNRISAKIARSNEKQIQGTHIAIDQLHATAESGVKIASDDMNHGGMKMARDDMKQKHFVNIDKNSYLRYLVDFNNTDLENPYVNLHNYDFILNNKDSCDRNTFILVLIHSDPRKYNERTMIRDTWGSVKSYSGANVVPVFLLAQVTDDAIQDKVIAESKTHLDIIQGNFIDSYRNLTYKCIMGLHWVQNYCNHAKFVVKVDDDTMINMYHLVLFLLEKSTDGNIDNFLYCSVYRNQGPRRTTDDKWYVSQTEYPYSKYPPYCEGFAYVMSNEVTKKLYNASRHVKFYWVDDVYVTGFAALKAGVLQRKMETGHGYDLMEASSISKNVHSNMFLLAKYEHLRRNWNTAWDEMKAFHKVK